MKKNSLFVALSVCILCSVFCTLTGCENPDPYVNPGDTPNPNWVITVENDMTSSMTAVVKVSFAQSEGILAAFIGSDCCGVTTSENYNEGRYNLYISPSAQGEDIQLKFYSPDLKRISLWPSKPSSTSTTTVSVPPTPPTPRIGK